MKNIMKTTRKATVSICLLTGAVFLSSCSGKAKEMEADTPEKSVQYTMESLQALDLKAFNKYTDNYIGAHWNWIGFPIEREYQVFRELLGHGIKRGKKYKANYEFAEKILEHLTWKIDEVHENGEQAEIDLEITNLDMTDVMGEYEISLLEDMTNSEGTGIGKLFGDLSELNKDKSKIVSIIDELDEESICTFDVTVQAYEDDGFWKVHLSDEFINAFMGNIMADRYSEDVERRIEELVDQYERKMNDWGEDFDQKMDDWEEEFEQKMD